VRRSRVPNNTFGRYTEFRATMQIRPPDFDRRQVYRPFLERLNSLSTLDKLESEDLIVLRNHDPLEAAEPPVHVAFARAAELTRGVQIALVGGTGSGKTTELWLTRRQLDRHQDAVNVFIDLAEKTDLTGLNTGAILATVGLELYSRLKRKHEELAEKVTEAQEKLRQMAYGKTDWIAEEDYFDPSDLGDDGERVVPVDVPGLLRPRFPALRREVREVKSLLEIIAAPWIDRDAQITLLIDGLDRLTAERFREFAEQDLRALKGTKISVIIVAPLLLWYDKSRFLQEYFDTVKHIPPAANGPEDISFLREILTRRGASELMDTAQVNSIVKFSGGVIRDLLTLVRSAASYAYGDDDDRVGRKHVLAAVNQLGNRYLTGLGTRQRRLLQRLQSSEEFPIDDPVALELLANRQVLEHFNRGRESFAVHPSLAKCIPKKA
jgi:hypothetical protein